MVEILVVQKKSAIGEKQGARGTLRALGLGRPGRRANLEDTPKLRGFKPPRRVTHVAVNIGQLKDYAQEGKVTPELLQRKGLVRADQTVKILGDGGVGEALEVHAHAVSA